MVITRTAWEQAKNKPELLASLIEFASMEAGQLRADKWLQETGLDAKCRVGVVGIWDNFTDNKLFARARVLVGGKFAFDHEETYIMFPSDHFKTKVLLVTGGT